MLAYALIPLLPLVASVTLALNGRRLHGKGHQIVIPALAGSFLLSCVAFVEVVTVGSVRVPLYRLLESGSLTIDLALFIDQLTVLLLLLVTGVSGIVHVYSARYMVGDARHSRFFALTALFTFAMVLLVMSSNLLLTYVCWEVMGLCSYLLISHYAQRRSAYRAATKAFLVNAVADVGLGLGVIIAFRTFGTLDIPQILASASTVGLETVNVAGWVGLDWPVRSATLIMIFLFIGAMGKSAQVPFHVWLPLAMEAPTPVSALIHAATMVNAGPFLLVRLSPLLVLSPGAMTIVAVVGAGTALFAAVVSLTQSDVKRILAFSTISQIGFMIFACGIGAFAVAIFHLLAHGFLKAFLFLSTGNALASSHRPSTSARRGTAPLFAAALLLALVAPVVLFSGPYAHLWLAQGFEAAAVAFWVVGLSTVFFTAMYAFRGVTSTFAHGPPAAGRDAGGATVRPSVFSPAHLASLALSVLGALAILTAVWTVFTRFLSPAVAAAPATSSFATPHPGWMTTPHPGWIVAPMAVAVAGWALAYSLHRRRSGADVPARWGRSAALYVFFLNQGYFDAIYDVFIVRPAVRGARALWSTLDMGIDRLVVGVATGSVRLSGWLWQSFDVRGIATTAERFARRIDSTGGELQKAEPRTLQEHLLVVVFWLIAAIGFFYWIV